jgi:2-octaprenyl-6-methoxyphenol hydroxylase
MFGYNIENRLLLAALEQRAAELPGLTRFDDEAAAINPEDDIVAIAQPGKGAVGAPCDRRRRTAIACREAAGIDVRRRELIRPR